MNGWTVAGRALLGPAERERITRLQRACEAAEPLDLKLELDEAESSGRPIHFLAEADGELIGYAGITPEAAPEACGMVDPAWRRRGVATTLLAEVIGAARGLGRDGILFICEDSSPVALAWMVRLGTTAIEAERRMVLRLPMVAVHSGGDGGRPHQPLEFRPSRRDDRTSLLSLLGDAFSESAEEVGDRLDRGPAEETLVALDEGVLVGTLRITTTARRSMIYGFVVDRGLRGRRVGTRMLGVTLERLRAQGVTEVGLEVDPENTPAVRLYEAFGFETVTTYRYMRMAVAADPG
jgi:ribosomal protein S18 acetylase RimI-like enzyme